MSVIGLVPDDHKYVNRMYWMRMPHEAVLIRREEVFECLVKSDAKIAVNSFNDRFSLARL